MTRHVEMGYTAFGKHQLLFPYTTSADRFADMVSINSS
jgi:hypothetical protein